MEPDWREALPTVPPGYRLHAALFTTFEPAQPSLLVEHLLPSVLTLARGLDPEPEARSLYFGELAVALERLRGRLTVISSSPSRASDPAVTMGAAYPWLWRYVTPLFTGENGAATQHAKLWMLHWVTEGRAGKERSEALEIVISSANLTLSSLRDQLQAGWRAFLPLGARGARARRDTWGPLPRFLEALGESAGTQAATPTAAFVELLARCECPEGVQLVASIPAALQGTGETSRWGIRALGKAAPDGHGPLRVQVCAPFVGEWQERAFRQWCLGLDVKPDAVALSWIDSRHPWAQEAGGGWLMSRRTLDALLAGGLRLRRLGYDAGKLTQRFHDSHRPEEPRWSHAKLYLLRRGRARRLLVTSANFSTSAWGSGDTGPRNFELGVLIESDWPIQPEEEAFDERHSVHTTESPVRPVDTELLWGQALWDGKTVELTCRAPAGAEAPDVQVSGAPAQAVLKDSLTPARKGGWEGAVPWGDGKRPPLMAVFSCGTETLEVPVLDMRTAKDFAQTPLPEVDPEVAQALRDALLMEAYGWPMVEAEDLQAMLRGEPSSGAALETAEDYSVKAFTEARHDFLKVEAWAQQLDAARAFGTGEYERILADGARLAELFQRRAVKSRLPAALVAEEFLWRLKEARS
ncbi:hypothetical protein D7V97_24570 [Corallococcus sp. CA053C]|nr:hypothetical protein D7V97_24570 [Corallococcus sp. CA053C]